MIFSDYSNLNQILPNVLHIFLQKFFELHRKFYMRSTETAVWNYLEEKLMHSAKNLRFLSYMQKLWQVFLFIFNQFLISKDKRLFGVYFWLCICVRVLPTVVFQKMEPMSVHCRFSANKISIFALKAQYHWLNFANLVTLVFLKFEQVKGNFPTNYVPRKLPRFYLVLCFIFNGEVF